MPKRKIALYLLIFAILINTFIAFFIQPSLKDKYKLIMELSTNQDDIFQVFYGVEPDFKEEESSKQEYIKLAEQKIEFVIPRNVQHIRIDFGTTPSIIDLKKIYIEYKKKIINIPMEKIVNADEINMIDNFDKDDNNLLITTYGNDAYVVFSVVDMNLSNTFSKYEEKITLVKKVLVGIGIDLILILLYLRREKLLIIPFDIIRNRKLIFYLAKNDFKTKYAGSYFGIFWAFIQPMITITLYWFVFQVGLHSNSINEVPFVLWLIAGLVPWFYYSDVMSGVTNCFIEYSYLVKKVVFNISILPVVKIISALFVHIFFLIFSIIVYWILGYHPNIYTLQIIYYTLCILALVLSLSYMTSALVLFFKDLGQIINIYLQIAMWMTPIMWSYTMLPPKYLWLFKLNPMYYIVEGYRDSLINKIWFFEKFDYTLYFWVLTGIFFIVGVTIFKKLKPHFSDVL